MMIEGVEKQLEALGNPKQAILCGIEAHACIAVRTHYSLNNETIKVLSIGEQVIDFSSIMCHVGYFTANVASIVELVY